jgi:hypothetical protein
MAGNNCCINYEKKTSKRKHVSSAIRKCLAQARELAMLDIQQLTPNRFLGLQKLYEQLSLL